MLSPFPGMDPYLEHPALWPDVHNRLVAAIADALSPLLRPRYYIALEQRTYLLQFDDLVLIGRPDMAVIPNREAAGTGAAPRAPAAVVEVEVPVGDEAHETFLEVREATRHEVVTILELLSPANKVLGAGRRDYEKKRDHVFRTKTHLVEVDLLRAGEPMPLIIRGKSGTRDLRSDYRILVSREEKRPRAQLHAFNLRDPIPSFPLPLLPGDAEPPVDLGAILRALYERASFDIRIDYAQPPVPPLSAEDEVWARERLRGR